MAQLVSHLFARALASETMHAVDSSGAPVLAAPEILGEKQPCLQAAAFGSGINMSVAVLNICDQPIVVAIDTGRGEQDAGTTATAEMTTYDLHDRGGKSALPAQPDEFPWPAPLTGARRIEGLSPNALPIASLSFTIVELRRTTLDV